jgi:hypothetical protein
MIAAVALCFPLAVRMQLSLWTLAALTGSAIAALFALVLFRKVITGDERLTYYHHEIWLLCTSALVLKVLQAPAAPYMDLVALGIGAFLACGRAGCLLAGCCYGGPCRFGVSYGGEHGRCGFPACMVGVRLIPVQAIEGILVLGIVCVGTRLAVDGPPGSAFSWYIVSYGAARFGLEMLRGDSARLYWLGLSEAQWTSLLFAASLAALEATGRLPFLAWHFVVAAMLLVVASVAAMRAVKSKGLFLPRHIHEIAELLESTLHRAASTGAPQIGNSALGVRISASLLPDGVEIFAFSNQGEQMPPGAARRLAGLIAALRRRPGNFEFVAISRGVYHVVLHSSRRSNAV